LQGEGRKELFFKINKQGFTAHRAVVVGKDVDVAQSQGAFGKFGDGRDDFPRGDAVIDARGRNRVALQIIRQIGSGSPRGIAGNKKQRKHDIFAGRNRVGQDQVIVEPGFGFFEKGQNNTEILARVYRVAFNVFDQVAYFDESLVEIFL